MRVIKVPFQNLKSIAHISDLHIRLLSRHEEYDKIFNEFLYQVKYLDNLDSTIIAITGDIFHSKCELSPESIGVASTFLKQCADFLPTIVIPGNHDKVLNSTRTDALTPIINLLNHSNLHYLKHSDIYQLADCDIYSWSIFDTQEKWPQVEINNRTKICLFHGAVDTASTDVGYVVSNRNVPVDIFNGFDCVLCGDIHRFQELKSHDPLIVMAGSAIQQNHGELISGHGWVEWNIPDRTYKFRDLNNEIGYYTIKVDGDSIPDYSDMPDKVRLRIFGGSLSQTEIKKLLINIRSNHEIIESHISKFEGTKHSKPLISSQVLDIFNKEYQNKLIKEYLKISSPSLTDDIIDRVIQLNNEKNDQLPSDDLSRKVIWNPLSIEFDNLFTYEEGNKIDFTNMADVIGIFGPNFTGKTGLANAICFALYDRIPQTSKAIDIMNTRKDDCYVKFQFAIENKIYIIERTGTRNKKGEVKMVVDFYTLDENDEKILLNGTERRYTNQNIQNCVGTFEDFLLTTFSSSSQQGLFVDRGQSDRKDLLSQFLGLSIFDKLATVASEESKDILSEIKKFKKDDFTQTLIDNHEEQRQTQELIGGDQNTIEIIQHELDNIDNDIQELYSKKISLNKNINIIDLDKQLSTLKINLDYEQNNLEFIINKKKLYQEKLSLLPCDKDDNIEALYQESLYEYEILQKIKIEIDNSNLTINNLRRDITSIESKISHNISNIDKNNKQLIILDRHKYDPSCEFCLKNGKHTIESKQTLIEQNEDLEKKNVELDLSIGKLLETIDLNTNHLNRYKEQFEICELSWNSKYKNIQEQYKKYKENEKLIISIQKEITNLDLKISQQETLIVTLEGKISIINKDIDEYNDQIESIDHNKQLDYKIQLLQNNKVEQKNKFMLNNQHLIRYNSRLEVLKQQSSDMRKKISDVEQLESDALIYSTYLSCVSRDGVPYKLITDLLPALEDSVNNILTQMTEFNLGFETDGKNINIKIIYNDDRMWPLEMGSGMERFVSSLAIRVALAEISTLPKSTFLIIDEGLGAFDANSLASLPMLFDVLRTKFQFILLISHVEQARDIADSMIEIKRNNGFSRIIS